MDANLSTVASTSSPTTTAINSTTKANNSVTPVPATTSPQLNPNHHLQQIPKGGTSTIESSTLPNISNPQIIAPSMSTATAMAIPPANQSKTKSKSRPAFDSLFDKYLDSDSFDLDFEEAYNMYNNLQHSNAINGIEQLEQVQLLNQQYITNFNNDGPPGNHKGVNGKSGSNPDLNGQYLLGDNANYPDTGTEAFRYRHLGYAGHHDYMPSSVDKSAFDAHRSQILSGNAAAAAKAAAAKAAAAAAIISGDKVQTHSARDSTTIRPESNGFAHSLPISNKNYLLGSPLLRTFTDINQYDFNPETFKAKKNVSREQADFQAFQMNNNFASSSGATHRPENMDEEDQFFSHMESNALEKFLDNLFDSNYQDPLSLYPNANNAKNMQRQFKELNNLYDLHTMKPQLQTMDSDIQRLYFNGNTGHKEAFHNEMQDVPDYAGDTYQLKRELTEVFAATASDPLKPPSSDTTNEHVKLHQPPSGSESVISENIQLRTPLQSRQSFSGGYGRDSSEMGMSSDTMKSQKRKLEEENLQSDEEGELDSNDGDGDDDEDGSSRKKRKRSTSKPLLTLEQKRLNHSHSEQKRRKLCKLAYERCLRLVINVDEYRKHAENCNNTPNQLINGKKSRRAMVNKDGLPNLSKHTALMKISNEIMTLQDLNRGLRELLKEST